MMQQRLQTLYELHYETLLSFATISLQNSHVAEDIVQETFLLFMEQEDKQIATRKKRPLFSIFFFLLDREKSNDATYIIPYNDNLLSLTEEGISSTALSHFYQHREITKEKYETLLSSLHFLSKQEQLLFIHVFIKKKEMHELISFYNIPSSTIRKRIERCRKHLKQIYLTFHAAKNNFFTE